MLEHEETGIDGLFRTVTVAVNRSAYALHCHRADSQQFYH